MRLAVVSPFVDRRHGTERAIAELLDRLAHDYGCEIHLYAERVEDVQISAAHSPQSGDPTRAGAILWHKVPSIRGPHLIRFLAWIFLNGLLRKWHKTFGGISYDLVLSPGINCFHPDVVIVHALFHRLQELALAEKRDFGARAGFFRSFHRRMYYGMLTSLERRIYANRRVTLAAVSKRTAGLLKQYFRREDVSVIPNGVDTKQFSKRERIARREKSRQTRNFRDADFVLLLIGNDWRNKGLLTVLEALAVLSAFPIRLLVAGNDNPEPFRARAAQLGVENRCRWESSSAEVLDWYAAADAYVSPSREDSFGLPVAEAMACGLPAITSAFAGVADYIRNSVDGFVLANPHDTQDLCRILQLLYSDSDFRNRMGDSAERSARQWTWDRNAQAVWQLLSALSGREHGAAV